jgi:hypothetical protein
LVTVIRRTRVLIRRLSSDGDDGVLMLFSSGRAAVDDNEEAAE